jgi:hypothetical protein
MKTLSQTASASSVNPAPRWVQAWNRFWFRPADPTTLGLIRICGGLVAVYVHLAYSYDLQEFFGRNAWLNLQMANEVRQETPWIAPALDWEQQSTTAALPLNPNERARMERYVQRWGIDPRVTLDQGNYYGSIWFHVTDPTWMAAVHGGILVIMFLFTIGLCTRITSVLTWLAALSYIQRSPTTLFGMDTILIVALLYLMIGPSGAALSVDRLLARYGLPWHWRGGRQLAPARPEPMVSANLALRLMQVHFCFIYMAAGLSKLLGGAWWSGTALWWTLANYEFTPLRFALYADALRWLCQHRWLWEIAMTSGVVYTLALEISFPFLVWNPRLRGLMVVGAVLLHTGIAFTMGLVGFGLIMLTLVLAFVPAETVRQLLGTLSRSTGPMRRIFPGRAGSQVRAA